MHADLIEIMVVYPILLLMILAVGKTSDIGLKLFGVKHFALILFRLAVVVAVSAIPGFAFGFHPLLILGFALLLVLATPFFPLTFFALILIYRWITMEPGVTFRTMLNSHPEEIKKTRKQQPKPPAQWIGQTGITKTNLRPSGSVMIEGTTLEAKVVIGFVESGILVRVVREEGNAVIVEPIESGLNNV